MHYRLANVKDSTGVKECPDKVLWKSHQHHGLIKAVIAQLYSCLLSLRKSILLPYGKVLTKIVNYNLYAILYDKIPAGTIN